MDIDSDVSISSNASQVSSVEAVAVSRNSSYTLSGSVHQAAEQAELIYQGDVGGVVTDTATFTLSGDTGQTSIAITKNESLADVAARINAATDKTGVTATQSGDNLVFSSVDYGSQDGVSIVVTDIADTIDISGVNLNPARLNSFSVASFAPGEQQSFDGEVTQAAGKAALTYTGLFRRVTSGAKFTVTGSTGSAEISVTAFEKLTSVRDKINQLFFRR